MDNASTVESTDAGTEAQPLNSDAAQANPTPKPDETPNQEKTFTQADINRIVARAEAKAKADALKQVQDERAQAEMSELEKERARAAELETRASEAENRARATAIRAEVGLALSDPKLNARDPKALAKLIDESNLDVGDDGEVTGIDAEIKRLRVEHPALFYSTTADGGTRDSGAVEVSPGLGRLRNAYANSSRRA